MLSSIETIINGKELENVVTTENSNNKGNTIAISDDKTSYDEVAEYNNNSNENGNVNEK